MALRKSGGSFGPKKKPKPAVLRLQTRPQPFAPPPPPPIPAATNIGYSTPAYTGGMGGYDIGSDPAVAAAHGIAAKIRANAQATALAKRKQAAIEYGDPTGVEGIDAATAQAARDNPFSALSNIQHAYDTGKRDLEENLNSANLFYSGYRGQQLSEADRNYQDQRYQAGTGFRGVMSDINDQLANALLQADMYEAQALMNSSGGGYDYGYPDEPPPADSTPDPGPVTKALNPYGKSPYFGAGYGARGRIADRNRKGRPINSTSARGPRRTGGV